MAQRGRSDGMASCAHCGLPLRRPAAEGAELFCCHACRMMAGIVGMRPEGGHSWNLLRLGMGTLLAMNVMMISLLLYSGSVETGIVPLFRTILLGLATPALMILLPPFLTGAAREIRDGSLQLDTLICGGSVAAYVVSACHAVAGVGEVYFDTATMLPVLVTVGKLLETTAKSRAADLLRGMERLLPQTALRLDGAGAAEVPLGEVRVGDVLRVRPGERLPVDGRVLDGSTSIEEAAFTGEFRPRSCRPGDRVIAGTVNGTGSLVVKAEAVGKDLLLSGIIAMVHDAWSHPSESQRIAERAARLFIPLVLALAAAAAAFWALTGEPARGMLSALSVLVVACPCTMGIATPLATALAIGRAARAGIVVRSGAVMEGIGTTDTAFFDKTGTLTHGKFELKRILDFDTAVSEAELLGRLAALESASEHPLAKAVLAAARRLGVEAGGVTDVHVAPGSGICGTVTWCGAVRKVSAGTSGFVQAREGEEEGDLTAVDVGWDGQVRGRLLFADSVRRAAAPCLRRVKLLGVRSILLSGDRYPAAEAVAQAVGMDGVEAPRTPAQKLDAVRAAIAHGKIVAMVGDGINDAPALAAAHAGIAMGAANDLARQAGNIAILSDRLMLVPWLMELSRRTRQIIRGNFAWSFGYNGIALAAAACGVLHPLLAALAMVASSVTVLSNSLRITSFPDAEERAQDCSMQETHPHPRPPLEGEGKSGGGVGMMAYEGS